MVFFSRVFIHEDRLVFISWHTLMSLKVTKIDLCCTRTWCVSHTLYKYIGKWNLSRYYAPCVSVSFFACFVCLIFPRIFPSFWWWYTDLYHPSSNGYPTLEKKMAWDTETASRSCIEHVIYTESHRFALSISTNNALICGDQFQSSAKRGWNFTELDPLLILPYLILASIWKEIYWKVSLPLTVMYVGRWKKCIF